MATGLFPASPRTAGPSFSLRIRGQRYHVPRASATSGRQGHLPACRVRLVTTSPAHPRQAGPSPHTPAAGRGTPSSPPRTSAATGLSSCASTDGGVISRRGRGQRCHIPRASVQAGPSHLPARPRPAGPSPLAPARPRTHGKMRALRVRGKVTPLSRGDISFWV